MASIDIAQALSSLILINPNRPVGYQPQGDGQTLPNFLFDYEGENRAALQSTITDHFVEDNTSINDHIALAPEKITVSGFIGELNDISPLAIAPLEIAAEKLLLISAYEPELTITGLNAYNKAKQAYAAAQAVANAAVATFSSISATEITGSESIADLQSLRNANANQNRQQIAFRQFYSYWRLRTLFTVQTPWAVFKNMAIENLRVIQNADSEEFSTFELTFKIIRFAETARGVSGLKSRSKNQGDQLIDFGTYSPEESISLSSRIA